MPGKRPIDIRRNAAITLRIGGDDDSPVMDMLSTGTNLYVIKGNSVYKIQTADNIDPGRTNPDIPNLSQQVLPEGHNNEIVSRILLTAKYLFDENNATVKPFTTSLLENCIVLTRQILELGTMTHALIEEVLAKERAFTENPPCRNEFLLPSIPSIDTKLNNVLSKADKAKDTILTLCRLQFLGNAERKGKLDELAVRRTDTFH